MGDVTVRIQGVGTGGSGGGQVPPSGNPPTPPPSGTTAGTSSSSISSVDNRMVEDLRRAIMSHGAVYVPTNNTFKPILQAVEQQQRRVVDEDITQKYVDRRADLDKRWEAATEVNNVKLQKQREAELSGVTDTRAIAHINAKWDKIEEESQKKLNVSFLAEQTKIDKEESEEKQEKQEQLTEALKELTDAINKSGTLNPDSYLGQLRRQRQEAIFERDNASDEESAKEAAKKVQEIDQQIKDVTDGRGAEEKKIDWGDRALQTLMGFNAFTRGMSSGNLGSMIVGAGQQLTSILGASDETASKTLAWLGAVSGITSIFQEEGQRSDQMAGLAALVKNDPTFGGGGNIGATRANMYKALWNFQLGGTNLQDMGLSVPDFASSAEKRISQRGMSQDGMTEAFFQEALERVFSLNRGSLGEAGKYDRYGVYATDAITNLVSRLERISGSGVTQGNYARVQEYLGLQQELMGNYMRFSDKPSVLNVNRDLAAFASLNNYTVDSRTSGDIKAVQNQLINPQNDRMKAILYSVVEETMPEYNGQSTRGRVDLIDQILNDPNYQGEVEKALMQRLTSMYGGYDTPMGYMMIKSQLQGIESPGRRKAIWEGITSGKAGDILSDYEEYSGPGGMKDLQAKLDYSSEIKDYVSGISRLMTELSDSFFNSASHLEQGMNSVITILEVALGRKSIKDTILGN